MTVFINCVISVGRSKILNLWTPVLRCIALQLIMRKIQEAYVDGDLK